MKKELYTLFLGLSLIVCEVHAQSSLPLMENIFGPTTANAATGNQGLTVALSKYGEVVNMKWPLPNYYDHINYKGLYPMPGGWQIENYNHLHNAQPLQGSFVGIEYKVGNMRKTTWLRDTTWTHKQYYITDVTPVIVTEYENTTLQLTVKSIDFVVQNQDAFLRKFVFQWTDTTLIKQAKIILSSNMAPCNKNPDFNPNSDWVNDATNGFANAYYSVNDEFVSFIPNTAAANTSLIPNIFSTQAQIDNFVANLDVTFPSLTSSYNPTQLLSVKDIYCVIGSDRTSISHGMLSDYGFPQAMPDSIIANGQSISTNAAQLYAFYPMALSNSNMQDSILFQFAFGPTYNLAQSTFDNTFLAGFNTNINITNTFWTNKLVTATIPNTGDTLMQKVLKRILVNTLIGINRGSGAIGSSVCASQPAYSELWARDNAIMMYMLDCAGYTAEAEAASKFFADVQRVNVNDDCQYPANNECYAGTWSQCYYADGRPSWMYDFEIDLAGWGVWMLYAHSSFLNGSAKTSYLNYVYPAIKRGANFLEMFKDTVTGLQLPAREDDVLWTAQTIYGASTTLMGLKAALSAGIFLNDSISVLSQWQTRIYELETAIQVHKWGLQGSQYDYTVYGNFGPRGTVIWPALLLDTLNAQMLSHADSLNSQITPFFLKNDASLNYEWWYPGKATTAMAYLWRSNPMKRPIVENHLKVLLKQVPTEGTYSYGETIIVRDMDSSSFVVRKYDNRVGQPSNHPAAWIYMTAEMLYGSNNGNVYTSVEVNNFSSTSSQINVFPNPSDNIIHIELPHYSAETTLVELFDMNGRKVFSKKVNTKLFTIDISGFNNGIYLLKTLNSKSQTENKVIVAK